MCRAASSCILFLVMFLSLHISFSFSQFSSSLFNEQSETYIVHVSKSEKPSVFTSHQDWYKSTLQSLSPSSHHPQEILYTYTHAANGFAARLTPSQASHLSSLPGIISILPEEIHQLQTTRTSEFLNLRENSGLSAASIRGDNVIIGVIDSGIWPEHPSFNDSMLTPVPGRWKGICESGPDFPVSSCNRKIVGARAFWNGHQAKLEGRDGSNELKSPRDTTGHGTHCASIAAGSYVNNAGFYKYAVGQAKGVAPRARIAVYKVCWSTGCPESDILAAMDQAVADGVDIISLSVGTTGSAKQYHQDSIAIGAFGAVEKGILVSCATGNAGPGPSTAVNIAPWILTVGASTIDRQFPADVHLLGDIRVFSGVSLYIGKSSLAQFSQLVFAGNSGSEFCHQGKLNSSIVAGKIVVCNSGDKIGKTEKGLEVQRAGGVGMIVIDSEARGDGSIAAPYLLPATTVSYTSGVQILKYIKASKFPRANIHFGGTTFRSLPSAPQIASFSSRGPNYVTPRILKPDVIAPGVNILAGWTGAVGPSSMDSDTRRVEFNIMSGTSMACPHVSGLSAMLRKAHPKWTPAAIMSALITSSYTLDRSGKNLTDLATGLHSTPFQHGAGHVSPNLALNPGLVYDIGSSGYDAFLCSIGYTAKQISIFVKDRHVDCESHRLSSLGDLNYPTFSVVFRDGTMDTVTYKRTVTNVGSSPSAVYIVRVFSPALVKITVAPSRLVFSETNTSLSYEITFTSQVMSAEKPEFGSIEWHGDSHVVKSPIAFTWNNSTTSLISSQ